MKRTRVVSSIIIMLLLSVSLLVTGCATTGIDRAEDTVNSIQEVDNEIKIASKQLDATSASLTALTTVGAADLKKAFDTYSDNLSKLDKQGNRVIKRVEEMKSQSSEHFSKWEKEAAAFTNPQIRALSEQRRNELVATYAQVPAAGAGIKENFLAYMTELKEIQQYLSTDLTPKGVVAITPVINNTAQKLSSLQESIKPLVTALEGIKTQMYGGK